MLDIARRSGEWEVWLSSLVTRKPNVQFDPKKLTPDELLTLHRRLLKPRMIEEKMLILLRQGKISKWFSGMGQEAISVGVTSSLREDEFILPMLRNLGVFTTRGIPLDRLFAQFQGKAHGFTNGRDRSFHFGSRDHHIVGMISHLGPQMGVADGIALGHKLNASRRATVVFTGDGGASEGDFHEALNVAAVWELPVLFVVENNGWGLSTPSAEQFRKSFVDKAKAYGITAERVDGNNVLDVFHAATKHIRAIRRKPQPRLLECMTFRMRGHEEASGTKYYPAGIQDEWAKKDPLETYQNFLRKQGVLTEEILVEARSDIGNEINDALDVAFAKPAIVPNAQRELAGVFTPSSVRVIEPRNPGATSERRFVDAISDGLRQAMERHDNLVLMGQDIAEYGGVFKVTEGFAEQFGSERVRNTPLCESAIIGSALGLSVGGFKSMVEMQFADFVTCGFNQIVNNLAKIHYRWGQNADVVVRMPTGAGVAAGPFHSQSNEAWFTHTPGLKVVYPSSPADAKGLIAAAIEDPNPVMYFEHKKLYRSVKGPVPDGYYTVEIGKANLVREGDDLSVITYGLSVHWAAEALDANPDISADLLDLRTLSPLDTDSIFESARKTGKVIILHEDTLMGGIGGEIAALINEHCFHDLDAPILRCGSLDTPVPFAASLEENFLPRERFAKMLRELWSY